MTYADDEGFVTISRDHFRERADARFVKFNRHTVTFPVPVGAEEIERGDWAWDGNGVVRWRYAENGQYAATRLSNSSRRAVTKRCLEKVLGRPLVGKFPVERIDGLSIYIRLDDAVE
jgi:hypothetical protein